MMNRRKFMHGGAAVVVAASAGLALPPAAQAIIDDQDALEVRFWELWEQLDSEDRESVIAYLRALVASRRVTL